MNFARKYFRGELSSYFMWTDHGRELCWCNGVTIAFHEEISAVLDRMIDQNLPDLSTMALGLATMRQSWLDVSKELSHAFSFLKTSANPAIRIATDSRKEALEVWPESIRKLSLLTKYVETYSPSTAERAELLALVLEDFASNYTAAIREELAATFRAGLPEDWLKHEQHSDVDMLLLPSSVSEAIRISSSREAIDTAIPRILRMLRIINSLASCIPCDSVEQLHRLMKTGLPDDIKPPEDELLDQRSQARGLLDQLSQDDELGGFARLTKQLIAAITLPRTLSEPDDLQMGGISDISNRGSLDKLLLSELAHDDLTLAVRLAMNEALYMRRETPPSPQTKTRSVLLDLSLPMWGIPRLYATAAALALHATSDKQIRIHCFHSILASIKPAPLTTREGLQDLLGTLEPTEHPGASLSSFFKAIADEPLSAEPVLITTSDVLEGSEFRQLLDKSCVGDLWLIVVERDGRLKVLQRTRQGMSVRKQLQLPLEEILSSKSAKKIRRNDLPDDLPAIFFLTEFPLLLSHQARVGRLWKWGETAVAVTDDGRLMHWTEKGLGARQLATGLAARGDAKIILTQRTDGVLQLLICPLNQQTGTMVTLSGIDGSVTIKAAEYRVANVSDVALTNSALLVFGKAGDGSEMCSAIKSDTGQHLGSIRLDEEETRGRIGRCVFHRVKGACVLNWVGGQTSWAYQTLLESIQRVIPNGSSLSALAEVGWGEYLCVRNGQLFDPVDELRFKSLNDTLQNHHRVNLVAFSEVSVDRSLLVVKHIPSSDKAPYRRGLAPFSPIEMIRTSQVSSRSGLTTLDLVDRSVVACSAEASTRSEVSRIEYDRAFPMIRQHTPHYRFSKIGVDSGTLVLKDPGGGLFQVAWDSQNRVIRLERASGMSTSPQFVEFVDEPHVVSPKESEKVPAEGGSNEENFSVRLTDAGQNVIGVIKVTRMLARMGLKEAKDIAKNTPKAICSNLSEERAKSLAAEIRSMGGTCEVLSSTQSPKNAALVGFTLQKARWENGNNAWLDSRGLLHLKSSKPAIPELTLVMRDGSLSGWLSSGEVFGDNYYCGKSPAAHGLRRVTAESAWNSAVRPFIESLPWNFHFSSDTAQTGNTVLPGY